MKCTFFADSSRRPSNESTCSLHVPLDQYESQDTLHEIFPQGNVPHGAILHGVLQNQSGNPHVSTPQVTTITGALLGKSRSQSLVNITRGQRQTWDADNLLNGIEESPKLSMRRGSLQSERVSDVFCNSNQN